jgi:hypothetical protein
VIPKGIDPAEFKDFYAHFDAPIAAFDCGQRCAPHNESGKPFCCDICHAVPTAYANEWKYLQPNTDLWFEWDGSPCVDTPEEVEEEFARLSGDLPDNMILIQCQGPDMCQRDFRGLTCRQFPFFPYVDSQGEFLGLSYYWEYEDVCWVVSNLQVVTEEYRKQFIRAFEFVFERMPEERETYRVHAEVMRDEFNEKHRAIPLLHRNGHFYKISSHNERMRRVSVDELPKFGPYKIAAEIPFPDEIA